MSVVVVHRDGWAACDSRTTLCNDQIMPMSANKAFSASGWLTAVVGTGVMQLFLERVQHNSFESEVLSKLSEALVEDNKEGHALLVNSRRKLVHLDGLGSLDEIDEDHDYFSIGCASMFVMGYLNRIKEEEKRAITPEDAKKAIIAASRYDAGIDDRVKIFQLIS